MSIRMGRKAKRRPQILPNPACYYRDGKYPDAIRASFNDGGTKVYQEAFTQPRPTFFSVAEIARMNKQPGSYKYGQGVRL